jgi:hypothetical protein
VSDLPVIFDPSAILPLRVTAYRRDPGYWLDVPGTPHRDFRYVDTEFGERIVAGLVNLPGCPTQEERS